MRNDIKLKENSIIKLLILKSLMKEINGKNDGHLKLFFKFSLAKLRGKHNS